MPAKCCKITAFTVSQLLSENKQGGKIIHLWNWHSFLLNSFLLTAFLSLVGHSYLAFYTVFKEGKMWSGILFSVTRQIHDSEHSNWLHKAILWLSHLFQVCWVFTFFYKRFFKTTCSFLYKVTFKIS